MAWPMPEGTVLGILAEKPVPGVVKPRIASATGPEFAALASEAMLRDTLDTWGTDRILAPGGRRVVLFDPPDCGPWFDEYAQPSFALQAQSEGESGDRMRSFFEGEFDGGAARVVVIGSDSPTLDPNFVVSAFLLLDGKDVVIGPSADGGPYLIGCRPPVPPIFEGVEWGTHGALSQVAHRLRDSGRSLAILPPWYVVDSPEGWEILRGHVLAMRLAGMDPGCPRVEALIGGGS